MGGRLSQRTVARTEVLEEGGSREVRPFLSTNLDPNPGEGRKIDGGVGNNNYPLPVPVVKLCEKPLCARYPTTVRQKEPNYRHAKTKPHGVEKTKGSRTAKKNEAD